MTIGGKIFDTDNRCYIMGILNLTPDSFSDGGKWESFDTALRHAQAMVDEGADIIDVGGESTRPGYQGISAQEEIDKITPVIEAISNGMDVPVSVDTYKSQVAEAGLRAGAVMVNDIWGFKHDAKMAGLVASWGAVCCLMQNRKEIDYSDFLPDLLSDLRESAEIAQNAGVPADKIILDPGVGFAMTYEMNLIAMNHLDSLRSLGYPVLLGASRKSVIGTTLDLPVTDRLEGTLATTAIAVVRGCSFVRVHDVKESKRVIAMTEAIIKS